MKSNGLTAGAIFFRPEAPWVQRAQLKALATQLPWLYAMLCTNAVALAFTHFALAPTWMTLYAPAIAIAASIYRSIGWRRLSVDVLDDVEVSRRLRSCMILLLIFGASFTAWSLALYPYGDSYHRANVAFFMSTTGIGCLFCLLHLRQGVIILAVVVTIPFCFIFGTTDVLVFRAMAANFLVVTIVMGFMAWAYFLNFRALNNTTRDLGLLSDANRRLAQTDSLTGLSNRRRFFADLEAAIASHAVGDPGFLLGLIDLDGFKPINDIYGHQAGDQVLVEIGRRLENELGEGVHVARLGGDEFALLAPLADRDAAIATISSRVSALAARAIHLTSVHVKVGVSMGVAIFPDMGHGQDEIIERADIALYVAKDRHRGETIVFSRDHELQFRQRRHLEIALRQANFETELDVVFQPIVDTRGGRVIAFESLARWTHPVLGHVSPESFIPIAERIGLIRTITDVLFRKACRAAADWPDSISLSFNLSIEDLTGDMAAQRLRDLVEASPLPAWRITFEVTETSVMRDYALVVRVLNDLRVLGCRIALDDFGTGYSSLSYVHRLPLDTLKIDRSFVSAMSSDAGARAIVRSVLDLCGSLSIACVVEGVETQDQADMICDLGGTVMQGWLFGKPMPASLIAGSPWSGRRGKISQMVDPAVTA